MAAHSGILAWKIPWMEGPWDRKQSDTTERLHFNFSLVAELAKNLPALQETWVPSLG